VQPPRRVVLAALAATLVAACPAWAQGGDNNHDNHAATPVVAAASADAATTATTTTSRIVSTAECITDKLMARVQAHDFVAMEQLLRAQLDEPRARTDAAWRICIHHFLGGALRRQEKLEPALAEMRLALEEAQAHLPADHHQLLDTRRLIAVTLGSIGRRGEQLAQLQALLPQFEQHYQPYSFEVAGLRRDIATTQAWLGNYNEVVVQERRVLEIYAVLARQPTLSAQNRPRVLDGSAQASVRLAEALLKLLERPRGRAVAAHGASADEALTLAVAGVTYLRQQLDPRHPDLLDAELTLALARRATGDSQAALALERDVLARASAALGAQHPITRKARNNQAAAMSGQGDVAQALALNQALLAELQAKFGPDHPETMELQANIAIELLAVGEVDRSLALAEHNLGQMEKVRQSLAADTEAMRKWQAAQRRLIDTYMVGLVTARRRIDVFLVGEHFKSRQLADRLALDSQEWKLPEAQRAELRRTRRELASADQALALARSLGQSVEAAERRQRQATAAWQAAREPGTGGAAGGLAVTPAQLALPSQARPPAWTGLLAELGAQGTAVLSILRVQDQLLLVARTSDALQHSRPIGKVSSWRSRIEALRLLLRPAAQRRQSADRVWRNTSGDYRVGARAQAGETEITGTEELLASLSVSLFSDLGPVLAGHATLLISTDDVLAHLPFALLPLNGRPLVERYALALTPSLEVLARSRELAARRHPASQRPFFGMGGAPYQRVERLLPNLLIEHEKPAVSPMDLRLLRQQLAGNSANLPLALLSLAVGFQNLPGTSEEVLQLQAEFGGRAAGALAYTGALAGEEHWNALAESGELARYRVIHLAAHGMLSDDEPALSSIVLAQLRRPAGVDGYLTAAELAGVQLQSDLFVVSACDSGVAGFVEGEGIMGLAYALFQAGSRHALLTLWPVSDQRSVEFMLQFHRRYRAGLTPTAALAATQRWAIGQGWPAGDWAAYVLHGQ
jgi:CHAT domain-containing protein